MKILVLIGGRKHSLSEAMAKLAMQGAYEAGADEVNAIRLLDLNFKDCNGCNACLMGLLSGKGNGNCIIKDDDYAWLDEQIMDADGIIVVLPIFEKTVPGYYKSIMDRISGPGHDVSMRAAAAEKRKKDLTDEGGPDCRSFKFRTAAFIGHGGSDWIHAMQPVMSHFSISLNLTVVEQRVYGWDNFLLEDDSKVQELRNVGRHVVEEYHKGKGKTGHYGIEGHCPVCHSEVFRLGETADQTVCCLCGMTGTLSVDENGRVRVSFPESEYEKSHMTMSGKEKHMEDLAGFGPYFMSEEGQNTIKKIKQYSSMYPVMIKE